ncbi:hypothetical protein Tco_0859576 [Tanacetum coccineum]|uniref:Uncharacterized protein n=1 Tax=Tanacetum coccineum TaxID=301880 RepID=A0ABQ5BI34_9ASTR
MAQPQRQSDVHQDELCPPNKHYALMDANKKTNLDNLLCPNESKILAKILQNHPLRFNIATSSSVPWIYLGQFWHTLNEDGSKVRDKYYNLEDDEMVKSIFNSGLNKAGVGMTILSWMISDEVKLMEHYRMYVVVFGVDVPTTQSQPIESTQGMHRTTSAPRTPNPDVDKGESSAPQKSTVIRLRNTQRRSTRLTLPTPIPTTAEADDIILQDTIQLSLGEQKSHDELEAEQNVQKVEEHLITKEIEKLVEGMENVANVEITAEVQPVNVNKEEEESADDDYKLKRREKEKNVEESRHTPPPTTIRSPRIHSTLISSDTEKLQELTGTDPKPSSSTPSSSSPKLKLSASQHILSLFKPKTGLMEESLPKMVDARVHELTKTQVPVYVAQGLIMERQHNQVDVAKMLTYVIQQDRENLRAEISLQINNAITNHIPSQVDSSVRNYMGRIVQRGRRRLSMEPMCLENRHLAKSMKVNQVHQRDEHQYHIDQIQNFLKNDIMWESKKEILVSPYLQKPTTVVQSCQRDPKAPALSLVNQDLLYLKKGNSGPEKTMMSLRKYPAVIFPDDDIEERTSRWVDKYVKKFNPYARYSLGVESYQQKVNLNAPTIIFPCIEKYKVLSIVSEPVYDIIYKNNKKEKRMMRHQEVHKFCDATLKIVLEGLKSYNNNVKHGYVTPSLSNQVRINVNRPLPLGGPPDRLTIQTQFFFNKDLEYLRYGNKGSCLALSISKMKAAWYPDFGLELLVLEQMWIEDVCSYDISVKYGITHWGFTCQKFYIDRHDAPYLRKEVRSTMRILSFIRIKAYSRYGYDYLSEIVLRRADYQEHTIAEKDFKNLYPSDFEDLNILLLQGHLDHLPGSDKRMLSTAVKLWTRNLVIRQRVEDFQLGYEFNHDYTIIESPRAVVFPVNSKERKIMRYNEIYKFSDGTLSRILEALDYKVKEYQIKRFNPGMNTRFWTQKDVTRSKEFMAAIERRLKTRRIFRNLECFVGGRVRDIDYRLLQRTE